MNFKFKVGKLYVVRMSYVYMWAEPLDAINKTHTRVALEINDIVLLASIKIVDKRYLASWLTKHGPCYYEYNFDQFPCLDILNDQ